MKTTIREMKSQTRAKGSNSLPVWIDPQLATLNDSPPPGKEWSHEIKLDGYRIIIKIEGSNVNFYSRNQLDWTFKLNDFVPYFKKLGLKSAFMDGEITVLNESGISKFQLLQNSLHNGDSTNITFFIFDLMYFNGIDLRPLPLDERRKALKKVLGKFQSQNVKLIEPAPLSGEAYFKNACKLGLEGIISKKRDAPYVSGRTKSWIKSKCIGEEEFVIGGFTPHSKMKGAIGALLLGSVTKEGRIKYSGKVGTGFSDDLRRELFRACSKLESKTSQFEASTLLPKKGAVWVKPKLLCEVSFTERTQEELLRHPSFKGIRLDKSISDLKKSSDRE